MPLIVYYKSSCDNCLRFIFLKYLRCSLYNILTRSVFVVSPVAFRNQCNTLVYYHKPLYNIVKLYEQFTLFAYILMYNFMVVNKNVLFYMVYIHLNTFYKK